MVRHPMVAVIIAGGSGTRLWPISRELHPKPFLKLADGESLLQKTFQRIQALPEITATLLVINREIYFKAEEELAPFISDKKIDYLLEPEGRNTTAAITAAALYVSQQYGADTNMLILPADHIIQNSSAFNQAVAQAQQLANKNYLVTFGIQPQYPETGYGYIEAGENYQVKRFVEKPSLAQAQDYLTRGNFLWNAGMFCFRAKTLIKEAQQWVPDLVSWVTEALAKAQITHNNTKHIIELAKAPFIEAQDISLDYAIMEKSSHIAVVACNIGWNDIGSWNAFDTLSLPDNNGNRIEGDALLHNSANCYIQSFHRLTAAVGVENLIIVDTPDALLVANRNQAQEVKYIVQQLKQRGHEAHKLHRTVHRPWGTYTVLEESPQFKIKRIQVKPGAALSLQMHHHRSEHWVVVSGTAKVTNGDKVFLLNTNESTFIPAGNRHRLENPGIIDLVMIEVQSGEYLGEDDIVRFEDNYGRN